ncbi:MAG: cytochrome b5-like heme/steroid binding domain-containing protein [Pseudomonadales bacterium]
MKKLCYTAFIAFWASIATIVTIHLINGPDNGDPAQRAPSMAVWSLEEVAAHNSLQDCWMIIEGKVYDLTSYLDQHPTRPSVILPYCGTDATRGMQTKGYGSNHSDAAWRSLGDYLIGELEGAGTN